MKRVTLTGRIFFVAMLAVMMLFLGCASVAIHGGSIVKNNDVKEYLVTYRAEGLFPKATTYHLVITDKGLAVYEQGHDGKGVAFDTHWEDANGDHFTSWIYLPGGGQNMPAYEFVVPKDRNQLVLKYVYPLGKYVIQEIDGIKRPVPSEELSPLATLISIKSPLIQEFELRDAAKKCDLVKVDSILETNPGLINAKDGEGTTPLKHAAKHGCMDVFNSLVAKGANVNIKDSDGVTPFLSAVANGHMEIVELLLVKGINVNSKNKNGLNALHYALFNDQKEMAEILIGKGCDIGARNIFAVTPLHAAAMMGFKEIAELLISKGADVNAKDTTGLTPLYYATKYKFKDMAELLRSHGGVK